MATFELCTDASDIGLGSALMQSGEHNRIVFLCVQKKKNLTPSNQNYYVLDKDCYATVCGIKQLRPYLSHRKLRGLTHHSLLIWLHRTQGTNSKLLQCSMMLQEYDMAIVYIKGKDNIIVDALSRKAGSDPQPTVQPVADPPAAL